MEIPVKEEAGVARCSGEREPDAEGAALAQGTFSSDVSTEVLDQGLRNGQSQPCALA